MGDEPVKANIEDCNYIKFESPCPVCKNINFIYWVHTDDNSHEKINKVGDIKCDNSKCYYNKHPLFIMNWAFNCGEHLDKYGTDYMKPGKTRALSAIHMLANNGNLNFTDEEENFIIQRINNWKEKS